MRFLMLAIGLAACSVVVAAERNIVLIVADDHGCDAGCYGNKTIDTPHIDALAKDGALFSHAFCTTASCSASRSVILTGMHNHANGQYGHQHDYHKFSSWANAGSLPVYLQNAGYRTARCGKFHVAPESVYQFQNVLPGGGRSDMQMADNCQEFIAADDSRPFFLYLCFNDPHRGRGVVQSSAAKPNRFGNEAAGDADVVRRYEPSEVEVPGFLPNTRACCEELAEYYQSVSRMDAAIGRVMEHLKSAGVYEKTLVVYMSDHGIAMPGGKTTLYEGGMRSPLVVRNPYETRRGVEPRAMVSWVDIAPTILDFAGALDPKSNKIVDPVVRKTQAESRQRTGMTKPYAKPDTLHGRSFLASLAGESPEGWDEVYASHTFHEITMYYPMRVVRERKYKLIWNIASELPYPFATDLWASATWQGQWKLGPDTPYGPWTVKSYQYRPEFELYDLESDPWEAKNLAGDAEYAATLERLKIKLKRFQRQTNDPWILKWKHE